MPRITKRTIDATQPRETGDVFLWDSGRGSVPGFGVRIKPSGKASFLIQYRNAHGRSRRLTLGSYGALTPDQAEKLARARLAEVAAGDDPAEQRQTDRNAMTVARLCRDYLDKAEAGLLITRRGRSKKPSTIYTDRGRIERHIIPLLGHRPVKDVASAHIEGFRRDVTSGKTKADVKTKKRGRAIVEGGKGTATRTLGLLGAIFSYAVREGYRTDNPVTGVQKAAYEKREGRLDEAGYRRLGSRLRAADRAGERWQVLSMVRLLALTGCRRGEIEGLKRGEVDLKAQVLRLGDTKTGKSVRPIGRAAVAELEAALKRAAGPYVFPAARGDGFYKGLPKSWQSIVARRLPNATPHTLRHSYASIGEDLGFTLPTIGALLGHAGHGVTAGYIHKVDSALVAAANRIADEIAGMMGASATTASNVVSLARSAS